MNLTDSAVRNLALKAKGREIVRDDAQPGFFVMVGEKTRTYFVQFDYKNAQGDRKTCRKKLGRADQVTAIQARAMAEAMIASKQPPAKPKATPVALTLRMAWREYVDLHLIPEGRSARTIQTGEFALNHYLSDWLDRPLDSIAAERKAVKERYVELLSHSVAGAYQAMAALKAIYNEALRNHEELERPNPVLFKLRMPEARQTVVTDAAEWYERVQELPNAVRREYHLFMLLSACRRGALSCARWEHLDVRQRALLIPNPKGGAKKAFRIPLSREMLHCLWRARQAGRMLAPEQAKEWIFPACGSASGHLAECKEKGLLTGHDLRRSWRTFAQEAGVSETDARLVMNHSVPGVNGRYIVRTALWPHLLRVQERISAFIMRQCLPASTDTSQLDRQAPVEQPYLVASI